MIEVLELIRSAVSTVNAVDVNFSDCARLESKVSVDLRPARFLLEVMNSYFIKKGNQSVVYLYTTQATRTIPIQAVTRTIQKRGGLMVCA